MDRKEGGGGGSMVEVVQRDWENREFIETIQQSILQIVTFLNQFDISTRYRLAQVQSKLTRLERHLDYLEASISQSDPRVREAEKPKVVASPKRVATPTQYHEGAGAPGSVPSTPSVAGARGGEGSPGGGPPPSPLPSTPTPGGPPPAPGGGSGPSPNGRQPPAVPGNAPPPVPSAIRTSAPPPVPTGASPPPAPSGGPGSYAPNGPSPHHNGGPRMNGGGGAVPVPAGPVPVPAGPVPVPGQQPPQPPEAPGFIRPPPQALGPPPTPQQQGQAPPPVAPYGGGAPEGGYDDRSPSPGMESYEMDSAPVTPRAGSHSGDKKKKKKKHRHRRMKLGPNKDISLKVLKEGDGETKPTATSVVIVDYTGYLSDGSKFDTSVDYTIALGTRTVVEGLEIVLQEMTLGSRASFKIPSYLAYGSSGAPGVIPPDCDLKFDLELKAIQQ